MSPSQNYRLRPGTWSDLPVASDLYMASFDKEPLLDYMFPGRRANSEPFRIWIMRRFRMRYWTQGYFLTVVDESLDPSPVDNGEEVQGQESDDVAKSIEKKSNSSYAQRRTVGFTWWHRPAETLSFYDRWLSPSSWFRPIVVTILRLHDYFFPIPSIDNHRLGIYDRTFALIEPQVLSSARRRAAWYLATVAVDPGVQGYGIGGLLVRDGLARADAAGAATWLVGLRGLENYYNRFGFLEVARANIGELKDWDGGSIMFRND
ncbi:hypothetical protein BGZ63DRAFT_403756 [Mariannaea sp. PMI_226]|nr:hypothetical protein BGZ63DRAFT_403756 [Mariannaea sp. PMI_226]